jgi:hypothetical protein
MAQGTATLDFGAYPGASDASVAVTGQTAITGSSLVEAWIFPAATTDHSADEHWVESLRVFAGNVVAGTGFTIYGRNESELFEPVSQSGGSKSFAGAGGGTGTRLYGKWNIGWVWN